MPDAPKIRIYRRLRYLVAGCGWLLVLYEWFHVSQETPYRDELTLVLVLIPSLVLIHAGVTAWIAHSKRLAARGKRGRATRYTSPVYTQDHLGRRLIMDEKAPSCKEINISIDGDVKTYSPATGEGG